MSHSRIKDLLNLSNVPRWSIIPTLRPQSVAEHSYNVAVICMELCRYLSDVALHPNRVIAWALVHDGPEAETGDVPYTAKVQLDRKAWGETERNLCPWYDNNGLKPSEAALVKIADKMEEIIFLSYWGVAGHPACEAALAMAGKLLWERVWEARDRYDWLDLPRIVHDIVTGCGQRQGVPQEPPTKPTP